MKTFLPFLLFLAVALAPAGAQNSPRQRTLMDAGWRFHLDDAATLSHAAAVDAWRWKADDRGLADAAALAAPGLDTSGPDWRAAAPGDDIFRGRVGAAWLRAALPDLPGAHRTLRLSVDDDADVYLNGVPLAHHEGWNQVFDVPLDAAWRPGGPNVVAMRDQNTDGAGGLGPAVTVGTLSPQADPSRPAFNDRAWRTVHLPHDYVVEGVFTPTADPSHGSLPTQPAWYRKTFTLPAADRGKSVWIDFDGIYRDAKVFLNGRLLGEHPSGYTGFRYDISRAANYGGKSNVLAVHVDPTAQEGWWYEGGGIYRHVWLNVANPVHVAPWGTSVTARLPEPGADGRAAPAAVSIQTTLTEPDGRATGDALCQVISRILDPAGRAVAQAMTPVTVVPGQQRQVAQQVTVTRPALWSIETPRLYVLHTEVRQAGAVVDAVDTPFGIRTLRFDPNTGFYLNGRPVKIKGTCNHQDFAGVGVAVPDTLEDWRVRQLKAMGSNAWRMSHNPPNAELLDACDREGMLVMDENRHLGDTYETKSAPTTPYADLSDLDAMVLRDRNHPSVVLWSLCNEEGIQGSEAGARIFAAMRARVQRYDTTRPVTSAMNSDTRQGFAPLQDVRGFNYGPGAYPGYHRDRPGQPLYGSETSSAVAARGVYVRDDALGHVTNYDQAGGGWANTTEDAWRPLAEDSYMAGGFVWTGFDYKGEPTPYAWPDINSNFGILDMCGFPKDDYYYYKAWWDGRPTVHLFPHWNWAGKEGKPINVWCYGNAARVELLLNGKSLGVKDMPPYRHAEWDVPYAPGALTVRGYDAAGRLIATDTVETTGAPAALRLTTARTTLAADGEDVTVVRVAVVDARGRVVPTAGNPVSFSVTGAGRVAGVGNGDPSDHGPDKASVRRAFNGLCMVLVGAGEAPGDIRLTAASPGLSAAALRLHAAK